MLFACGIFGSGEDGNDRDGGRVSNASDKTIKRSNIGFLSVIVTAGKTVMTRWTVDAAIATYHGEDRTLLYE
jgi:hypothetical protein